jgi:uncharacterized protein Yka (UPF0111/DUF47 family)
MRWLLPRDDTFFVLFERSAASMVAAADALRELFTNGPIDEAHFQRLDDLEHDADNITHEVIARIGRTFITPLDRDDIHRLIHALDDIVDQTEATGETALLCGATEIPPLAQEMTRILADISREVAALIPFLRGGSGYRTHIVRAHELENEGDRCWSQAFSSLFDGHLDPVEVIKWKEIYEVLEAAIDACETAAQIIEEIVFKQA